MTNNKIILISGISGSGKTSLVTYLSKKFNIPIYITSTTRPQRPQEVDKVNYYFLTEKEFKEKEFIEFAKYNNYYYGLEKEKFNNIFQNNFLSFLIVDYQGLNFYKKMFPNNLISIYIDIDKNKSLEFLEKRDGKEKALQRFKNDVLLNTEKIKKDYQYIVINNKLLKDLYLTGENLINKLLKNKNRSDYCAKKDF